MTTRSQQRKTFPPDVRFDLLDADADQCARQITDLRAELNEAIDALRGELKATRAVLTGLLVAVTTSSIILLINVVVTGHH
jgi:hypothetical protein